VEDHPVDWPHLETHERAGKRLAMRFRLFRNNAAALPVAARLLCERHILLLFQKLCAPSERPSVAYPVCKYTFDGVK